VISEDVSILVEGAKSFGILLKERDVDLFALYLGELLKWNQKINLTAIRTEKEIIIKHFLDSLSVYPYLPKDSILLDIGSGAGFPGIPLKIVQPSIQLTLIDSARKKVDFQKHIIRTLGLKGVGMVHGRVQDRGILDQWARKFDVLISRAFSNVRTLLALGYPSLKEGGMAIAMKGELPEEEILLLSETEAPRYRLAKTVFLTLPLSSYKRTILLFQKD
jgi:16S rRNA (guanine527-N7)-methyltransferase